MAKSSLPIPNGGSVLPKVLGFLVTIAVVVLVVKHPTDAAHWFTQTAGMVGQVIDGLATFLRQILG